MFHITMRRRRFLLMILLCEVALFVLLYQPDYLTTTYFPARPVAPSPPQPVPDEGIVLLEQFAFRGPEDLKGWEEKSFNGKTLYQLRSEGEIPYLNALSDKSCSGLYRSVQVPVTPDLFIEWAWRAKQFPKKQVPTRFNSRKQDDFSARIYLVFPGTNFFKSDVLEYLWDGHAPLETVAESPFSDRIKMIVVASGSAPGDGWLTHKRNVLDDYRKAFGKDPQKPLGILAVMSDSDNTHSVSEADFGGLRLFRKTDPSNVISP